jgi:AcrR family transcriptional regulator
MGTAGSATAGRRIRGLDADQRQAQRRQQLLDAALALIASQGYANTSIEQICQTAYVGTKGFYELFDSKEACYLALLDETIGRVGERMLAALRQAPADEDEAIRALASAFVHAVADDSRVARATFGQTGSISAAVDRHQREVRRWGAQFIEHAWRRYGLVCAPADELHPVAVGVVGGSFDLVVDWLHDQGDASGEAGDIDTLIDALTGFHELVRAGLASQASRAGARA